MTTENNKIPDWAVRERHRDLAWIGDHLPFFWLAATTAFVNNGRGAMVVDTTAYPRPEEGFPFGYVGQGEIEEAGDAETQRLVREYAPAQELVVMLMKAENRTSSYRIRPQPMIN